MPPHFFLNRDSPVLRMGEDGFGEQTLELDSWGYNIAQAQQCFSGHAVPHIGAVWTIISVEDRSILSSFLRAFLPSPAQYRFTKP